jgi:hypothetical protein
LGYFLIHINAVTTVQDEYELQGPKMEKKERKKEKYECVGKHIVTFLM